MALNSDRIFRLLDRTLDIAQEIRTGDLLEALKATTLEIERTDAAKLSGATIEDLRIYARRYFPKKRYSVEERKALEALGASIESLRQRRAVLHDLVRKNHATNAHHEG